MNCSSQIRHAMDLAAAPRGAGPEWIEFVADGVLLVTPQGQIAALNRAFLEMSGLSRDAVLGQPLSTLIPEALKHRHAQHVHRFFEHAKRRPMGRTPNLHLRHADGHDIPVDISLGVMEILGETAAVCLIRDVSELKQLYACNEYLAMYDVLTGLRSRFVFNELLSLSTGHARRGAGSFALLLIDLDDFKSVNDGYGHQVGDALLREVACRLQGEVKDDDVVARLGGDEFGIILAQVATPGAALSIAESALAEIKRPWCFEGSEIMPSASIGIAFAPQDGDSDSLLLRHADMAMYQSKERGRGVISLFNEKMTFKYEERVQLLTKLKKALSSDDGAIELHYQPQVDAGSQAVVAAEALMRWTDAELGPISPARFIPLAESCGLIVELGEWVIDRACRQIRSWQQADLDIRVAVNVSPHHLNSPRFESHLAHCLAKWEIDPTRLEVEITESAAMLDAESVQAVLNRLRSLGISLALDDFGTGYSSLSQLSRLPVSRLKVDRSFVRGIADAGKDALVMKSVVAIGKTLGMNIVAEGVETAEQALILRDAGCDELQGWHYSAAVVPAELPMVVKRLEALAAGPSRRWAIARESDRRQR